MSNIGYASLDDMQAWARTIMARVPDFVIGPEDNPYLRRWWIIPRNEGCNVYLHEILRSDDDRAGHDHPWSNTSHIIEGEYVEVQFYTNQPWIERRRRKVVSGQTVSRDATDAHRLILPDGGRCVSLFITGPKVREWGFWCPNGRGFVHWRAFTAGDNGELVGKGCGE